MIQECILNLDAAEYKRNIYANLYKPSGKNEFNCHDSDNYWPTSIKETIQWFPLLTNMEHTAKIMGGNNGLISSLLKVFAMFELRLSYKEGNLDVVYLRCINCKRETGLFLKNNSFDEIITKFVLNAILHHVGLS